MGKRRNGQTESVITGPFLDGGTHWGSLAFPGKQVFERAVQSGGWVESQSPESIDGNRVSPLHPTRHEEGTENKQMQAIAGKPGSA